MGLSDNWKKGDPLTASDLNEVLSAARDSTKISAEPPLEVSYSGGTTIRYVPDWIWAKITGSSSGTPTPYSWVKTIPDGKGNYLDTDQAGDTTNNPAFEINNATATVGSVYKLWKGVYNEWLFAVGGGGGGSSNTKMCRITGAFYKDPSDRTPWASPLCYYPATIQKADAHNGWSDTTDRCWWVLWMNFNFAIFPPVSAGDPYTAVIADGSGAHLGIDLGFSYNPQKVVTVDGTTTIIDGDNLPVYGSDSYSAAWAIQCVADESGVTSIRPVEGG